MTTMSLTETQVREFVADWYHKLDIHVPLPDLLPLLSRRDLTIKFPEVTVHSHNDFAGWYDKVTHRFFDEVHTVKQVDIRFEGGKADCNIVVNWEASTWDPPEAKSKRLIMDAAQRWLVSAEGDQLVINLYDVISLTPLPGSAPL